MERKHRATRTDSYKLTIAGLLTKRAEMAGERVRAVEHLAAVDRDLGHLDAVLAMFGVTDGHKVKPLQRATTPRAKRADVLARHRAIFAALRSTGAATTTQLAEAVAPLFKLHDDHEPDPKAILSAVRKMLHRLERQGGVVRDGWDGDARVWRLQG
ncbi:hypothetical protein SI859A1_01046 [Aurantimonas manganoxydans SI85-9A1]|uniref:Uncharacterized protein n=1 Tax=Aurantimonas manganoxydans (strain ATCC BAA-1229 / DSM 21871 / SI85-9A1) TaxID=287752 RepID=Q1YJF3_AURMS|nr:hypothetical protein [Aurantimonas manganoxydans]EAS50920.1 hypothetical protein SI859A1_01046 [Aurantimonas manganoxydans SI85-9A1]